MFRDRRERRRQRIRKLYNRYKRMHKLLRHYGQDILDSENFKSTKGHLQHGNMTVHNHCMDVARYSLLINKKLQVNCNKRDLIRGALYHCIEKKIPLTDDCSAVEQIGKVVTLTAGERTNIKITTQFDLLIGEAIVSCLDAQ